MCVVGVGGCVWVCGGGGEVFDCFDLLYTAVSLFASLFLVCLIRVAYLCSHPVHDPLHQRRGPWQHLRDGALGDPEPRQQLVVQRRGLGARAWTAVHGGEDVVDVHGRNWGGKHEGRRSRSRSVERV